MDLRNPASAERGSGTVSPRGGCPRGADVTTFLAEHKLKPRNRCHTSISNRTAKLSCHYLLEVAWPSCQKAGTDLRYILFCLISLRSNLLSAHPAVFTHYNLPVVPPTYSSDWYPKQNSNGVKTDMTFILSINKALLSKQKRTRPNTHLYFTKACEVFMKCERLNLWADFGFDLPLVLSSWVAHVYVICSLRLWSDYRAIFKPTQLDRQRSNALTCFLAAPRPDNHRDPYGRGGDWGHRAEDASLLLVWEHSEPDQSYRNHGRKRED